MSIKVVVRIMEEMDLPRPWASVLIAMGDHADDDGKHCFPSVDKIAWKANYKWRQVVNIMRDMEKAGVITRVANATQRRPTEYQINFDSVPKKTPFEKWREANGRGAISQQSQSTDDSHGCNPTTPGMQPRNLGVQSHNENSRENASEPSVEPPIEPKETNSANADGDAVAPIDSSNANRPEYDDGIPKLQPFDLASMVMAEVGVDMAMLPNHAKGKQLAVAKRLIADGMTVQEGAAIARWLLRDEFWRSKGIDMMTIESQRMRYISAHAAQSVPKSANDSDGGVTIAGTWISQGIINKARSTFQWYDVLYDSGIRHVTKEQVERMIAGEKVKDVLDPETAQWLNNKLAQHILQVDSISRV